MNSNDFRDELQFSLRCDLSNNVVNMEKLHDDLCAFRLNISCEDIQDTNLSSLYSNEIVYIQTGLGDVDPNKLAEVLNEFDSCVLQISSSSVIELDDCDLVVATIESKDIDEMKLVVKSELYDDIDFSMDEVYSKPFIIVQSVKKGTGSKYNFRVFVEEPLFFQISEVYSGEYELNLEKDYSENDSMEPSMAVSESDELETDIIEPGTECKRCPKHKWSFYGELVPYSHSGHKKFLGYKSKEICSSCGAIRWRNILTGSDVKQKSQDD